MQKEGIFYTHKYFKLLTGQKSGRKSRTAQTAIKLQNKHSRRSKHIIL